MPKNSNVDAFNSIQSAFPNAIMPVGRNIKKSPVYTRNLNTFDQLQKDYYIGSDRDQLLAIGLNSTQRQATGRITAKPFGKGVGGVVYTGGGKDWRQININARYLTPEGLKEFGSRSIHPFSPKDADIATMVHEFGHLIFTPRTTTISKDRFLQSRLDNMHNDWNIFKRTDIFKAWQKNSGSARVGPKINREKAAAMSKKSAVLADRYRAKEITYPEYLKGYAELSKTVEKELKTKYKDTFVTMYGYENEAELIAESFTAYKLGGTVPEIARIIGEMIDRNMKR